MKKAIRLYKFEDKERLARPLAVFLEKTWRDEPEFAGCEGIVPVPLFWKVRKERGFNSVLLLAQETGRLLRLPVLGYGLKKIKPTLPQRGLKRKQRLKNIQGVFAAGSESNKIVGKKILLVDDLFTTGATAGECSIVLKQAGAKQVFVLTLARGA